MFIKQRDGVEENEDDKRAECGAIKNEGKKFVFLFITRYSLWASKIFPPYNLFLLLTSTFLIKFFLLNCVYVRV